VGSDHDRDARRSGSEAPQRGEPKAEHEPKHPVVKFVLAARNEGDFSEAEKYVAPNVATSVGP